MGLKWDSNALAMWRGMNILKKESCRMCRYALICGGGCPFSSIIQNKSHCTSFYKMFETSINRIYQHKKAELFF